MPVVRPHQEKLPILQVRLELMLKIVVRQDDLRRLQAVLTIKNPEHAILDSRPIFLRGTRSQSLGHGACGLPIPLHVVHEVVGLPQHTPSLARPNHPFVRGFLILEEVHIESEVAFHGPAIL